MKLTKKGEVINFTLFCYYELFLISLYEQPYAAQFRAQNRR